MPLIKDVWQSSRCPAPNDCETRVSSPISSPSPKNAKTIKSPEDMLTAPIASAEYGSRPTIIVSTMIMDIHPSSARISGIARRNVGRSSFRNMGRKDMGRVIEDNRPPRKLANAEKQPSAATHDNQQPTTNQWPPVTLLCASAKSKGGRHAASQPPASCLPASCLPVLPLEPQAPILYLRPVGNANPRLLDCSGLRRRKEHAWTPLTHSLQSGLLPGGHTRRSNNFAENKLGESMH